jgi:hypothetical protein
MNIDENARRRLVESGSCGRLRAGTKPYTPKTTGKAELFIQTALREWASRLSDIKATRR